MKTQDRPQPLAGIILTACSVLLVAGALTFAGPCAAHDGVLGPCVWANRMLVAVGVVTTVIGAVRIFELDEGGRRGLSFACGCLGVLIALTPGVVIDLCADPAMPCQTIMRPFALAVGGAIALVGFVDLALRLRAVSKH